MFDDPVGAGVGGFTLPSPGLASPIRASFVVAIPVKNEEERLPTCLRALGQQFDRLGRPIPPTLVSIVVFANNCTDHSASLARKLGGGLSLRSASLKFDRLHRPRTLATLVARRWILPRLGLWKEARGMA